MPRAVPASEVILSPSFGHPAENSMIGFLRVLTGLLALLWWIWLGWSLIEGTFKGWIIPILSPAFACGTGLLASRLQREREENDPE